MAIAATVMGSIPIHASRSTWGSKSIVAASVTPSTYSLTIIGLPLAFPSPNMRGKPFKCETANELRNSSMVSSV